MLDPLRTYRHVVSAEQVDLQARELENVLRQGGVDLYGYDLSGLAAHQLAHEAVTSVTGINITVTQQVHGRTGDGGAEVWIEAAREQDVPLMRVAIG